MIRFNKLFTSLLLAIPFTTLFALDKSEFPNGIAAVVEKRIITIADINRRIAPMMQQIQRDSPTQEALMANMDKVGSEVLESLIDECLLIHDFYNVKQGKVPRSYLENHFTKLMKERFEDDRSLFLKFLEGNGMTEREFKTQQEEDLIMGFTRTQMRKSISEISPDRIQKYYDTHTDEFQQTEAVHMRQIMLSPIDEDDENKSQLNAKADAIIKSLKEGEVFAEIAKKDSQGHMKESGGDWGWMQRGDMREELCNAAFKLNKGEYSDPIHLDGYAFILYAEDRREAGLVPLIDVRTQIEQLLANESAQVAQARYVKKLRKTAHIKYHI